MEDLDRWIAKNIMGWVGENKRSNSFLVTWHPKPDITQAFQVVDKVREPPQSLWLSLFQYPGVEGPWRAIFRFGGMAAGNRDRGKAEDLHPATAMCLALKEAVGD